MLAIIGCGTLFILTAVIGVIVLTRRSEPYGCMVVLLLLALTCMAGLILPQVVLGM